MIFIELISSSVTHIAMMFLFNILYDKKKISKIYYYLAFVISTGIMVGVNLIQIPVLNVLYTLIAINVLNKVLYKCKSNYFVLYNVLAVIFLLIIDMVSVMILSLSIGVDIDTLLNTPNFVVAGQLINFILIFISLKSFTLFTKRNTFFTVKKQELFFYLLLTGLQIYALHFITSKTNLELLDYKFILLLIAFLIIDVYVAFLIYQISKDSQIKYELKLAKQQLYMQFAVYSDLLDKYILSRSVKHDVNGYLRALEGLIDGNCIDSARQYTKLLNRELDKLTPEFKTSNQILSVIINNKISQAKKMGISMVLDVEDLQIDFISDLDITSIFANVLDTVLKSIDVKIKEPFVKLTIHKINNFIVVNVFSKFSNISVDEEADTLKEEQKDISLLNVQTVIDKYDGVFQTNIEGNEFTIKITIPVPSNLMV